MNQVTTESELSFEVTFDQSNLFVAISIYDDSGVSPVLISGPTQMSNVVGNMYRGKFTPQFGKSYLVFKAVYTDALYTVLNTDYQSGSESFKCEKSVIADSQIVVKKGVALLNFPFLMVDVLNQNPITGLTVAAKISKDGGAFANTTNAVTEIGLGFYKLSLTALETTADSIGLIFSSLGADDTALTILTQK